MDYKISIIIPIHNIEKYLNHTLDSLLKQTIGHENIEVIMVNDCSTDQSQNIMNEYAAKYKNFKAIHLDQNCGLPGKPRNIGLDQAQGEYVMFMDHDDYYSENACEVLYKKITENNADLLLSRYIYVFDDGRTRENPSIFKNVEEVNIEDINEDSKFLTLAPSIWTKIFRKSFLIKNNIRFPEGILAEDLSFVTHSLIKAHGIVYLNNFFSYNYRIRDSECEKSTIHIRNRKYLMAMIEGYHNTYSLLKELNREIYFPVVFQGHLNYWTRSLILSDTSSIEKIELMNEIRFFYDELEKSGPEFKLQKNYHPLINRVLKKEFNEAVLLLEVMNRYEKKQIDLENKLNARKNQVAKLQTTTGWFKYKIKNIFSRIKKKL